MCKNPLEFLKNLFRAYRIFRKERPDLIVSTGAEIAIPVILIGKLFGATSVYVECGAQVVNPSVTGRVMYWLSDHLFLQWHELTKVYGPKAKFAGSLVDEMRDIP